MTAWQSHVWDGENTLTTWHAAKLVARMIPSTKTPTWLRTDHCDVLGIVAMTLNKHEYGILKFITISNSLCKDNCGHNVGVFRMVVSTHL